MKDVFVTSRMFFAGVCEEYNVRRILFDISTFQEDFGPGNPVLLITRPGEEQSYPISPEVEGDYAVWIPQQRDTDIPGAAKVVLQWYVDGGLAISTEYYGRILGEKGDSGDPGPAGSAGADGKSAYESAVEGGYTGTEADFAAKLAREIPTVDSTLTELVGIYVDGVEVTKFINSKTRR